MKLENIFTADELNSINAGTYNISNKTLAAKLDFYASLIRADALEEAAKLCESKINNAEDWDSSYWDQACGNCSAAIRGMK